ncbi:hypothetical protein PMZ80_010839 [Knufia obscura]|uniref:Uncharacterized protein n=1 Tax=Knufia obscura TaxID=1635080 RepID=A0ABR0R8E4_9EURO|nr:hypothetical protein PMZ80_010839 [Knufia obscura]
MFSAPPPKKQPTILPGTLIRSDPVAIHLIKQLSPHAIKPVDVLSNADNIILIHSEYADEIHRVIPEEIEAYIGRLQLDEDSDLEDKKTRPAKFGKKVRPEESKEEKARLAEQREQWVRDNEEKLRQREMRALEARMQVNRFVAGRLEAEEEVQKGDVVNLVK